MIIYGYFMDWFAVFKCSWMLVRVLALLLGHFNLSIF